MRKSGGRGLGVEMLAVVKNDRRKEERKEGRININVHLDLRKNMCSPIQSFLHLKIADSIKFCRITINKPATTDSVSSKSEPIDSITFCRITNL